MQQTRLQIFPNGNGFEAQPETPNHSIRISILHFKIPQKTKLYHADLCMSYMLCYTETTGLQHQYSDSEINSSSWRLKMQPPLDVKKG